LPTVSPTVGRSASALTQLAEDPAPAETPALGLSAAARPEARQSEPQPSSAPSVFGHLVQTVAQALTPNVSDNENPESALDKLFLNSSDLAPAIDPAASVISDRDLLMSAISLAGGANPEHLSEPMLAALRRVAAARDAAELKQPEVVTRLVRTLQNRMGRDAFEQAAGASVAGAKSALMAEGRPAKAHSRDLTDAHRGWGWKLLSDDDPAFSDPRYLARFLRESGTGGRVLNLGRPQAWTDPWNIFVKAWRAIAPASVDPRSIHFALTGTDANNMLYYIASRAYRQRLGLQGRDLPRAEILVFDGAYGGGGGQIGRVGLFNRDPSTDRLRVPSPDTTVWNPTDPDEIERLRVIEDRALAEIEAKVSRDNLPIGGLLIESVQGAAGVRFYRPEFLLRVRELCDRLQIPIFADEVLTGGGRTGKFFAYQNYPGFEPDFVTFGKGLQVAGVAQTDRGRLHWGEMPYRTVTLRHYNEILLKSAQVMTRIKEGGLMDNAQRVGAYIVEKLRAQSPRPAPRAEVKNAEIARGLGMLIFSQSSPPGTRDVRGRMMPPVDLTLEEADRVFGPSIPGIEPEQRKFRTPDMAQDLRRNLLTFAFNMRHN
jgi:acetylornithine/succinyldiaminopimelate/putrescine aminotransferase